jgi:hypothetical protein
MPKAVSVARQPELPLKLNGGYSRCLAGDQIIGGKPDQHVRLMKPTSAAGPAAKAGASITKFL